MSIYEEPVFDVAQLAHIEILSPKPEETVKFFTRFLGLMETAREGQSVYLRTYGDLYHHSLKVTEHREAGLGHVAWRTSSPQALQRRATAVQATGFGRGWIAGDIGHGKAYQFTTPDGHMMELLWDVDYLQSPKEEKSKLLSCASERPHLGIPVRRLNHVHLMDRDPGKHTHFMQQTLGFRLREQIVDNGIVLGSWMGVSNLFHETAVIKEPTGRGGKLHHLAYWYDVPQNLYDVVDVLQDNGMFIEVPPDKQGINGSFCMYVYEPGGNRVKLFSDAGHFIFDPAWEPLVWDRKDVLKNREAWGVPSFPESFWAHGTPATITHKV